MTDRSLLSSLGRAVCLPLFSVLLVAKYTPLLGVLLLFQRTVGGKADSLFLEIFSLENFEEETSPILLGFFLVVSGSHEVFLSFLSLPFLSQIPVPLTPIGRGSSLSGHWETCRALLPARSL